MLMFRSTHDTLMAAKDAEMARVTERRDALEARYEALVTGLAHQQVPPPVVRPAKREPDAVDTAIDFKAGSDSELANYLKRYAKQQRRAGVAPQTIAQAVLQGEPVRDDEGLPEG